MIHFKKLLLVSVFLLGRGLLALDCGICFEELAIDPQHEPVAALHSRGRALASIPAQELQRVHAFHAKCLTPWVEKKRKKNGYAPCPTCRAFINGFEVPGLYSQYDLKAITWFHNAVRRGNKESVRTMLPVRPWLLTVCDKAGKTPLMCAAEEGRIGVIDLLLSELCEEEEQRQYLDQADYEGKTALMYAADEVHSATVRSLLRWGAAIDLCDKDGETALFYASRRSASGCLYELLRCKADQKIRNTAGQSALEVGTPLSGTMFARFPA